MAFKRNPLALLLILETGYRLILHFIPEAPLNIQHQLRKCDNHLRNKLSNRLN